MIEMLNVLSTVATTYLERKRRLIYAVFKYINLSNAVEQ